MNEEIKGIIDHLENIWNSDCDASIENVDGCNVYYNDHCEITIDKEALFLYVSFEMSLYPEHVADLTLELMYFAVEKSMSLVILDSFFTNNGEISYGKQAKTKMDNLIQKNIEQEIQNELVLNELIENDNLHEC